MTLRYWVHHEEELVQKAVLAHLQTAGIILVTLAILVGLYLGAMAASGLHEFNLNP